VLSSERHSAALEFARGLFASPELFPGRIAEGAGALDLARISPADHRSAGGFLAQAYRVPLAPLLALRRLLQPPRLHARYIFTAGYCGSTLLTRSLDALGCCLPVIEPRVVDDWAQRYAEALRAEEREHWLEVLDLLATLLFRPPDAASAVVVKGGEYANGVMSELFALPRRSTGLFLYAELPVYLPNILKSERRREEFRRLLRFRLRTPGAAAMGLPEVEPEKLSDAMSVAYLWLGEAHLYEELQARSEPGSLKSLNFDRFLDDPRLALARIRDHFQLGASDARVAEVAQGPLFREHSKNREGGQPGEYDRAARQQVWLRHWHAHETEIQEALRWVERDLGRALPCALAANLLESV
jgi:hypothetical protein